MFTQSYIGQCDKIRQTLEGEDLWRKIMSFKRFVSKEDFMDHIDPSNILDEDETIDEFMKSDPDAYYAYSRVDNINYWLIGHSGFEFIWRSDYSVLNEDTARYAAH
jgi:hypothetical protein